MKTIRYIQVSLSFLTFLLIAGVSFANMKVPTPHFFNLPIIDIQKEIWPLYMAFCFFLIVITLYEINYLLILDVFTLPGILMALMLSTYLDDVSFIDHLIGVFSISIPLIVFANIYEKFTKKECIGGGFIKLSAMIGAFIGSINSIIALSISIIIVLPYLLIKNYKRQLVVAEAGPVLSISALTTLIIPYKVYLERAITWLI